MSYRLRGKMALEGGKRIEREEGGICAASKGTIRNT